MTFRNRLMFYPSSPVGCFCNREMMVNGINSSESGPPVITSLPLSQSACNSISVKSESRPRRCSLIREEFSEEDEYEFSENGFGFEEVKECRSANELTMNDSAGLGKLSPISQSTAGTPNTRLLPTVHSMPQLVLNQISEEDEEEEMSSLSSAFPCYQPAFSIAGAENFGGCARKANRKSSVQKTASVQSEVPSAAGVPRKLGHRQAKDFAIMATKDTLTDCGNVPSEVNGRQRKAVIGHRRNSCGSIIDEDDSSILVRHFSLQREPLRQHSLVQGASDTEDLGESHTDSSLSCSTTNSLDRRLFQHARKDGKNATGRLIVGAVKKSVGMLLGHLSAVGDVTSAKPRRIETWSSCSDLMQASVKLRCTDASHASVNLADRQRVAGCQLARELRQNRSEREALFTDANKSQSSSSCVIRVRSRDFDKLVSKFAAVDETTATSTKTDSSSDL